MEDCSPITSKTPKTPNTPSSPRTPSRDPSFLAREKSAARQFLWTTSEAVMVRPAEAARRLPLPMAVVCTPFADSADFTTVPISHIKDQPMRCPRCRCYANPHFCWSTKETGKFACNMCDHRIEVSESFKADMARNDHRADEDHHPELVFGSVDFTVPGNAEQPPLLRPALCFALETSARSVRSGFAAAALDAIEELLALKSESLQLPVCLVTFGEGLTFTRSTRTGRCQTVSMQDVDDPFLPLAPGMMFLDLAQQEQREAMLNIVRGIRESLALCTLPDQDVFPQGPEPVAGGSALRAAVEALTAMGGGDVFMFHCSFPSIGVGAFAASDVKDDKVQGKGIQQGVFYEDMLQRCTQAGIAVSCITAPPDATTLDVETLQWLSWRTGGDTLHLPSFNSTMISHLCDSLSHWTLKMQASAYNCVFKLRCSKGLSCHQLFAAWPAAASSEDGSAFEMARISADTTMAFTMRPELDYDAEYMSDADRERQASRRHLFVQVAILYTNTKGERLLRVHTTSVKTVSSVRAVYASVSIAPLMALLVKQAAGFALDHSKPDGTQLARDCLLQFCLEVLVHYSNHCGNRDVDRRSLVTCKKLLLLPLYVLTARKLIYALVTGSDNRNFADDCLRKLLRMPIHSIMAALYPRVYSLESICGTNMLDDDEGLPSLCPAMEDQVAKGPSQAYLICNGFNIWYYQRDTSDDHLREAAEALAERIRVSMAPCPAWIPLSDMPKLSPKAPSVSPADCASPCRGNTIQGASPQQTARSWQEQLFLSTVFVEDEGVTEMSYSAWLKFLRVQLDEA